MNIDWIEGANYHIRASEDSKVLIIFLINFSSSIFPVIRKFENITNRRLKIKFFKQMKHQFSCSYNLLSYFTLPEFIHFADSMFHSTNIFHQWCKELDIESKWLDKDKVRHILVLKIEIVRWMPQRSQRMYLQSNTDIILKRTCILVKCNSLIYWKNQVPCWLKMKPRQSL